jgi:hypothetical protein
LSCTSTPRNIYLNIKINIVDLIIIMGLLLLNSVKLAEILLHGYGTRVVSVALRISHDKSK